MIPAANCSGCPVVTVGAFACLETELCARLSKAAVPHVYQRGQYIFYQDTPALAVYCLRSGLVTLTRQFSHSEPKVVGLRTPGDLFGHRAVIAELPYGISAEATEQSIVCTVPREDFLCALSESRNLASRVLKRLAIEFRLTEELLVERSSEPVAMRTARFLARLEQVAALGPGAGDYLRIPARREDLARLLGTTAETLSRSLHDLAKRGLVVLDGKHIRVPDPARLQRFAG